MNTDYEIAIVSVVDGQGHFLMIHRLNSDEHNGGKWEFPAGHVDPGERPEIAAVREVWEETGLKVYLMPWHVDVPTKVGKAAQYLGFVVGGEVKPLPTLAEDEHDRFRWVSAHNVEKMQPTHRNMKKHLDELLHTVNVKLKRESSRLRQERKASADPGPPFPGASPPKSQRRARSPRVMPRHGDQVGVDVVEMTPSGVPPVMKDRTGMSSSRRANESIPTRVVVQLPGPGEDLREAILVGDEVEIFLKDQARRGDRPAPDFNGIVDQRNRNTLWIKPIDEDDDKEKMGQSILWKNDGSWAFIRVYRDPNQVIHFVRGNPYDPDQKVVENAKGLGLILESDSSDSYESVWDLMRGETPDLDRALGQAPQSFDNVAPFSKPRPGIPPILHRVRDVLRNSGLEPDLVEHLGNGRILILTSDSDLKKDIVRVLQKDGHEIKATRQGGLMVRDLPRRVAKGTTTIPIEDDTDMMRSTVVQRQQKMKREKGRKALSPFTPQTGNQGAAVNPNNPTGGTGFQVVVPPADTQVQKMENTYGKMDTKELPSNQGTQVTFQNQKQFDQFQKDLKQDPAMAGFFTANRRANRSQQIRILGRNFRTALRTPDYAAAGEILSALISMGISETQVGSRLASRSEWEQLYIYSVGAGATTVSRLARNAMRVTSAR